MNAKNYTDVIIAGKVYTVGGFEEEDYLQKVAGYLNQKHETMRQTRGYLKQSPDYQNVLMQINVADDYFRMKKRADSLDKKLTEKEKEVYSLKQESITTQMKLESVIKELEICQKKLEDRQMELEARQTELEDKQTELDEKRTELDEKRTELEAKQTELEEKQGELEEARGMLKSEEFKDNITKLPYYKK